MSSTKKHKTLFKKKKTSDYWGDDGSEPQYTEEQKRRIASYLKDNDENCKESTTLILIIVIGLLVALSIVGFLAIRNHSSIKFKGSHIYGHSSNSSIINMVWGKWTWLQNLYLGLTNGSNNNLTIDANALQAIVALEEELNDFQPIYRNPLLQKLYKYDISDNENCNQLSDDDIYTFISIKHGSWIPSIQYLNEAVDFSWADFEAPEEKEEIELVETINKQDQTNDDIKQKEELKKQIEKDRKQRKEERQKKKEKENKKNKDKGKDKENDNDKNKDKGKDKENDNDKNKDKGKDKENDNDKNKQLRRRLLDDKNTAKNPKFDPLHAMPNPANIIDPHSKGDEGAGDVEAEAKKHMMDRKNKLPGWLKKGIIGGSPRDFAKDIRNHLPFGNRKHLKHLDDIRKNHLDRGVLKSPKDILSQLDLSKYGINKKINDDTTEKEKEEDLKTLEKKEANRHPYMTLLTNPGKMEDVKCIKNNYRKHELIFKKLEKTEAINTITNGFDDGEKTIFSYDNNVLMWYCYLITIQEDAINNIKGSFKVNLTFHDVNMEVGFDYIQVYINSQLIDTVSGIGLNWEDNEASPSFVYYMDSSYVESNGNAMEICMKIVTDGHIIKDGFSASFNVNYDDPQITKWSDWSECTTVKPSHYRGTKNDKHWNGDCGVGIRNKKVTQCIDATTLNMTIDDRAICNLHETITQYCIKTNCYDFPMVVDPEHPSSAFKFNGHGRIDPDFPDPFIVQRSIQDSFNITYIINELAAVRDQIISRYPDEKVLGSAVINHYYMDQSKLRLGIRLARSLLLGDSFTVYTTGSSNTAGHENMFFSTWSMQLQSIMRPVWKRIGYKGAAFMVKNHAEGGGLGTMQLGPCIPSLVGDDADVVFWESQMNDHGDAAVHMEENHFRNVITLPRRPMYHVMHAGKNGPNHPDNFDEQYASKNDKKGQFKNEDHCYNWICGRKNKDSSNSDYTNGILMEPYTDYGSGLTMFYPTNGLASVNRTKYEEFKTGYLYVSWHPGPTGHRVYAEMLAYHYLTSVLETFTDIRDLIDDLTPKGEIMLRPIEEMLEILEDPPRKNDLPHDNIAKQCDPFCTNATESVCISGYKTLGKPRYSLKRFRSRSDHNENNGEWNWGDWMANPEALIYKKGGQAHNDIKSKWETNSKDSGELKFIFEAKQYGFISLEGDEIIKQIKNGDIEVKIFEINLNTGDLNTNNPIYKQNGKLLKCIEARESDPWLLHHHECNIGGLNPYQKYQLVINVIKPIIVNVKNIRIF